MFHRWDPHFPKYFGIKEGKSGGGIFFISKFLFYFKNIEIKSKVNLPVI